MKTQSMLLAALASAPSAMAHTAFTDFYVNGQPQGDGVAIRMHDDPAKATFPIASLDSDDMACNVGGTKGVSRVQSVPDGATLTFEMRSWPDDPSKPSLDRGHKGPCAFYLKKVDSAINDKGTGDGWFKIFDHGYDASTKRWCTDELIDNKGLFSVKLPKGLEGGYYLARPEVLALHAANSGDPQFYPGCGQIFLESNGNLVPEETVSIPGYVKYGQPSTDFDIYNTDNAKYELPGPKVARLSAGAGTASTGQTSQTEGQKPSGCIVENANWCGKEVPDYNDEKSCWAADSDCWAQQKTCYDSAPPTGDKGCKIWDNKCTGIQTTCKNGNWNGPPNKGKVLTPDGDKIDVGLIMATSGGGVDASSPKTSAAEVKTSASPKYTSAAATSAAAPQSTQGYEENKEAAVPTQSPIQSPKHTTITVPASEQAPAPTAGPSCPKGYECVTVYTTAVVTEVEYQTIYANKKRASLHHRRQGHWF